VGANKEEVMRIGTVIHEIASGYLGQREVGQNDSFENDVFQRYMTRVGWERGQAWCSYFAELCWKQAYKNSDEYFDLLDELFSASAVQTFRNFKNYNWDVGGIPSRGALAVWQHYRKGKKTWRGHIAIVEGFENDTITTIDGNSNSDGSSMGYEVARVKRVINIEPENGLGFLGFIYPEEI
jgi:hypothetical protein